MVPSPDASLLDYIPLACYVLDHRLNFTYVNPSALGFFRLELKEMLGKNLWEVFPQSKNSTYYSDVRDALSQRKVYTFEYVSDFSKSWIRLKLMPIEQGTLVSFSCIEKDKHNENLYQTLVENTPDEVSTWDSRLRLTYANAAFLNRIGYDLNGARGKTLRQLWPGAETRDAIEKIKEVLSKGGLQSSSVTFNAEAGELFYDLKLAPEFTVNGMVKRVIAIGRDLSDLKRTQTTFNNQLRHKYTSLFNSMTQGFCIIEVIWGANGAAVDYRFIEVNPAFVKQTGIHFAPTKTIKEVWPDHEAHWFQAFGNVVETQRSTHFELPARAINGWYEIEAFPIHELGKNMVGVIFNDISDRKHAETILKENEEINSYLLQLSERIRLLTNPLDIAQATLSVLGEHLSADFAFYGNIVSLDETDYLQIDRLYQKNPQQKIFRPTLYPLSAQDRVNLNARYTHTLVSNDNTDGTRNETFVLLDFLKSVNSHSWIMVPLFKDEKLVAIMGVSNQQRKEWSAVQIRITEETAWKTWTYVEQAQMEMALKESQEQLGFALRAANMSTFHYLARNGKMVLSPLSPSMFGLKDQNQQSEGFHMIHPEDRAQHEKIIRKAAKEQKEYRQIYRIVKPINDTISWIEERGRGIYHPGSDLTEIRGIHWDITAQKNTEDRVKLAEENYLNKLEEDVNVRTRALQESRDELAAIYNNTLMSISVLKAIKDATGTVIDFEITLANKALEKETGRTDLIGKWYAREYPGIKATGLFDMMLSVLETGISATTEYFYPFEDFNKWYTCMFVKMGDSLLATNLDVSERKIAEQLFNQNSAMIEGIANSAPDMLYAIELNTMQQFYSNSRIEQLVEKSQQEIKRMGKDFFEQFIHPEDKDSFYAGLATMKGNEQNEVNGLCYRVIDAKGQLRWINTKSTVYLRDDAGVSTHIVGISQDVTQQKELEEKNKQLTQERNELEKKQQVEILKAQEEERHRLAERLHNGLGQVLYGVKTTLERLSINTTGGIQENQMLLNRSKKMLGDCIRESRRISHQLMPSILEDFGLKEAIHDICRQLRGKTHFTCNFMEIDEIKDNYLQLAIYRIVQELSQNIVKHAQATVAQISLSVKNQTIYLAVKDNGKGFSPGGRQKGIGLKTIESKVKLLNGTFRINTIPTQTAIHITIPIG